MMKISKLLKVGAFALLATSLCFVSCKKEEDEENAISGDNISMTHDGTSGNYYRAFSTTTTKHYSATAKITINNADTVKNSGNAANCALGYVFGLQEVEVKAGTILKTKSSTYTVTSAGLKTKDGATPKFYTFGLVGIRYSKSDNSPQWYVSWCENVPSNVFNYNDATAFYATLYAGSDAVDEIGRETQIIPTSGAWDNFTATLTDAKALSVTVKSIANDDGSYTIKLLDAAGSTSISSEVDQTVPASVTGLTEKTQLKLGRYTTVYNGETASGVIKLEDVSGAAVVFEEE